MKLFSSLAAPAVVLACAAAASTGAHADWYSGDPYSGQTTWPQYSDYLFNSGATIAMSFDNFTWSPGSGGGVVDSVGGHYYSYTPSPNAQIVGAYWEIRSGMGVGNGGTLVASGFNAATSSLTSFTQGGNAVWGVDVDVADFALGAGNYWFGMAIQTVGDLVGWFHAGTSGANGVGGPLGDDVHLYYQENQSVVSWNYVDGAPFYPEGTTGFDPSYWINEVPTPGGAVVLAIAVVLGSRRRSR